MSAPSLGWPDVSDELGPRHTIIDFLLDDGVRLQALVAEARAFADEGFVAAARRPFAAFAHRLERHMRLEERVVLPLLPASAAAETERLLQDHARLRRHVATAQRHLDAGRAAAFARTAARLGDANRRHERREHRLYAPARARI